MKSVHLRAEKIKVTINLSRPALAALARIGAKRFEAGASRRGVQQGVLIEEAIELLKRKEDV